MCILTLPLPEHRAVSSRDEDRSVASDMPSTPETSPRNHWTLLQSVDHISEQRRAQVETIKAMIEVINSGDLEKMKNAKPPDFISCAPQLNICVQGNGDNPLCNSFSNLSVSLDDIIPDGSDQNRVCVQQCINGVQTRPFIPFLPVGQRVAFSITVYLEFGDYGKPMRGTYFFNSADPLMSILRNLPVLLPEQWLAKSVDIQSAERSVTVFRKSQINSQCDDGKVCVETEFSDDDINLYMAHLDKIEATKADRSALVWITEEACSLAAKPAGSRLLQRALDVANAPEQCKIAERFKGHVLQAATSLNANHVLQKLIALLPPARSQFIIDEMHGHAASIAQSRCGCRVFERLLEHCPSAQVAGLVDEMLDQSLTLCRHSYANFVIKSIFQFGSVGTQRQLACAIATDIHRLARHRVANHVVRSALIHCDPCDRSRLVGELSADPKVLGELREHPYGSFVYREIRRSAQSEH